MQEKDIILKEYEEDSRHFCDFVNGVLAGGRPLLVPERLEAMPTEVHKIVVMEGSKKGMMPGAGKIKTLHRFRDLTKKYCTEDGHVIIAIQNQGTVDFGMPLRVMLEDALEYDAQMRQCSNGKLHKGERLQEVITIVFYHGSAPWSGAKDMKELIHTPEELKELEKYRQGYSLILVTPDNVEAEKFQGEWREILEVLKRQNDEKEMSRHLEANRERYDALTEETNRLLFALTGHLDYYRKKTKKGESAKMCKAFEDHYQSGVREGRREGRETGIREGREAGLREGKEAGLREGEERGRLAGKTEGIRIGKTEGIRIGKTEGILEGRQENEKRFQSLIAAMVRSGEAALLPRLAEPGGFLAEMYQKYSL